MGGTYMFIEIFKAVPEPLTIGFARLWWSVEKKENKSIQIAYKINKPMSYNFVQIYKILQK